MNSQQNPNLDLHDEDRWRIVASKNCEFDGIFYTGVRTTKIYCKPSCAAKTPKRENVRFFRSCDEAELNNFRACLRCKPRQSNMDADAAAVEIVRRALELLGSHDENFSLEVLCENLNVNAAVLTRAFKTALKVSPKELVDARRFEMFKRLVKETDVTTALYNSGFGSSRALYERANEKLGMTPAIYRKNGKNMKINFAIVNTNMGKMLVAATEKGVCKISSP